MGIVGFCKVADQPSADTNYFFGPVEDIAGKELKVIERNFRGDCLCVNEKGLIDVAAKDVVFFRESAEKRAMDYMQRMFSGKA
jgi:hypothetical protein